MPTLPVSPFRCLVVDLMHESLMPMLQAMGVEVTYVPDIKKEEVPALLPQYHMLVVRSKMRITAELLTHAPNLQVLARAGAGVDNIDDGVLEARNITLINAPEGNRDAVGEHTLGLLLTLFRKINQGDRQIREGQWLREDNRGEELGGKTVGLIGYGHMGKAFARRLMGFDCEVLAYDRQPVENPFAHVRLTSLEEIQEKAQVLSLHIPYTKENHHFVDARLLASFAHPLWLLNTARGEVLDHEALVEAMKTGHVLGAALDVLENEKLKALTPPQQERLDYLLQHPRVILTPHIAGWTHESYVRINEVLVQKLQAYLASQEK
ncbi:phosphoglycerate dehydrogenase [Rufibacter radiotolerans]|uniref:Phosphoglycerate dehydrogenase n=1 Tax=Rufibacter radiotolerans TaxID=1379910 RepID=A0A0H4VHP2_9BACT|nr:NAD(P)-dependent oxidoreductase [Rufibacter radiotolerans]AKQ45220.1 phosphoglycerate dehydrogenase [Rufibacter radiotolerans]